MPSRVIRAEILSSESLAQVSLEADLLFRSIVLLADDYGRLDGRLPVLRALAFPLRPQVTTKKIERWLTELAQLDDPPIVHYIAEGRPYIWLTGWEKHRGKSRRAKGSKFPPPPRVRENEINASPEIRENPSNPPEGMESGVWGKESREISGEISDLASPSEWDLRSRKLRPKPRRFEGEAREQILEWAKSNGHSGRIIDDGFASWETWGTDKMRSIQSWADTFKGFVRRGLANGEIQAETASERASREAEEFRESAAGARPEPGGRNQIH